MKKITLIMFALLATVSLWQVNGQTYNGNTGGIPDANCPTLTPFDNAVSATGVIGTNVGDFALDNVTLNISHTWDSDLTINLVYSFYPEGDLSSFNIESLYTSNSSSITLESLGDFVDVDLNSRGLENTKLPVPKKSIYSLGLEKKNSWFIGLQYESKLSSSFENVFLNIKNVDYRDSNSFSIGGYIIPDSSSFISYWKRIKYRFGIKNEKKSIIVNNLPINQFSLNLGLGLPIAGLSKANLGLELGKIGNDDNLIKENYFALRLGLSLNDVWFIKRKFN